MITMMYPKYKYAPDEEVERMQEFVTYDGCDVFGPESKLYDLYVWYKKDGVCYIDKWHAENWYDPNKKVEYERTATHHVSPEVYKTTIVNGSSSDSFLLHLPHIYPHNY